MNIFAGIVMCFPFCFCLLSKGSAKTEWPKLPNVKNILVVFANSNGGMCGIVAFSGFRQTVSK